MHNISIALGVEPGSADLAQLRYHKICILADADSDGQHIATLLCALFLRHFRPLVLDGHVYVAMPPLYRIDAGKQVYYALDEAERDQVLERIAKENPRTKPTVTRFKGLGEMNPTQLRETTIDPRTRRLVQLTMDAKDNTDQLMDMLLAKKRAGDRREWLEEKGNLAASAGIGMPENQELNFEGVERQPLRTFTEKAYLDYSMYVILDRALPALGDGLKPVQRRIIYAMSELGLRRHQAQEVRAHRRRRDRQVPPARRLRLLRGHGADGAAVLLPLSDRRRPGQLGFAGRPEVLRGHALHRGQAHPLRRSAAGRAVGRHRRLGPNFDGTLEEPVILPARLPNLLLNGTTGIAVGMATDIPPHNLREVAAACMHLLEEPEATTAP